MAALGWNRVRKTRSRRFFESVCSTKGGHGGPPLQYVLRGSSVINSLASMDEPELTELLLAWGNGDDDALARIAPLVHAELYRLAKRYMSRERPDHLLQTSALINEAYVRLIDWKAVRWQNRAHFFGVAAQMMRRILVDFARKRPKLDKDVEALNIHSTKR